MGVPNGYLAKAENVKLILEAMQKAATPETFTHEFLRKQLGFTSSGDRPIITILKAMAFLADSGAPLPRYLEFKDSSRAPIALAHGLRDAYADVFAADQNAQTLSSTKLQGIFARVSGKSESVSKKMASTFKAFCELADFKSAPETPEEDKADADMVSDPEATLEKVADLRPNQAGMSLHHDIHLHLPESTNVAVYDAIFKSLRTNLVE